jgi:hypothetical protein
MLAWAALRLLLCAALVGFFAVQWLIMAILVLVPAAQALHAPLQLPLYNSVLQHMLRLGVPAVALLDAQGVDAALDACEAQLTPVGAPAVADLLLR